jgi:hypothetical protein
MRPTPPGVRRLAAMLKYRTASEMPVNLACSVPREVKAQLRALAEQKGVALSTVVRELIEHGLSREKMRPTQ